MNILIWILTVLAGMLVFYYLIEPYLYKKELSILENMSEEYRLFLKTVKDNPSSFTITEITEDMQYSIKGLDLYFLIKRQDNGSWEEFDWSYHIVLGKTGEYNLVPSRKEGGFILAIVRQLYKEQKRRIANQIKQDFIEEVQTKTKNLHIKEDV